MRCALALGALAFVILFAPVIAEVAPPPVVVTMSADRFDISAEGNAVTGLRRAPVSYTSVTELAAAVRQRQPIAAVVRLVRAAPPR